MIPEALTDVQLWRVQALAGAGSILFLALVVTLIRRRHLREEYSLLWLGGALLILAVSLWRGSLVHLARLMGVAYAPAALFILLLGVIVLLLLHFSLVISHQQEKLRRLAQELALLREEMERKG